MYPYEIIFGLTLYDILLALGVLCAVLIFRYFSDRDKISVKFYNFIIIDAVVTVIAGYILSVVTQAVYNWLDGDGFSVDSGTGATFLGGLLGGAAVFLAVYFGAGKFVFGDGENRRLFPWMTDTAAVCIPAAHALGRLGCLSAGCCHGRICEEPTAFTFRFCAVSTEDELLYCFYAVPVQLYEAMFLAALAAVLFVLKRRNRFHRLLSVYMMSYGVWRFFIEYLRGDDRGATFVSFLSPSQLTSLVLIAGGIIIWLVQSLIKKKKSAVNADAAEPGT